MASDSLRAAQLAALLAIESAREAWGGGDHPERSPATYDHVARVVADLQAHARKARATQTRYCNAGSEDMGKRMNERFRKWESLFLAEFAALGLPVEPEAWRAVSVTFGGDPRGVCAFLRIVGVPGDGFCDGFAIY